jgi:hypothetical protein
MPDALTFVATVTIDGDEYKQQSNRTVDGDVSSKPSVPAAKAGQLTTYTDANTGVLTMAAGHGILTADKLDVFWVGGSRRNMTVGTVATNSVPVDGGSGDDLPADETAVTAMVPVEREFNATGDSLKALGSFCPVSGWVVYRDAADAELLVHRVRPNLGGSLNWTLDSGVANPLAGDVVANVLFSHDNANEAVTMRAAAAY